MTAVLDRTLYTFNFLSVSQRTCRAIVLPCIPHAGLFFVSKYLCVYNF